MAYVYIYTTEDSISSCVFYFASISSVVDQKFSKTNALKMLISFFYVCIIVTLETNIFNCQVNVADTRF